MSNYNYVKSINSLRLQEEIIAGGLITVLYINTEGTNVTIVFSDDLTSGQITTLDSIVSAHQVTTTIEYIASIRSAAIVFGCNIINQFIDENIALGIIQAGMTNTVRKRLFQVKDALTTGSLRDAIYELKNIPSEDKDGTFINNVRILAVVNKLEVNLGLPLTISLT